MRHGRWLTLRELLDQFPSATWADATQTRFTSADLRAGRGNIRLTSRLYWDGCNMYTHYFRRPTPRCALLRLVSEQEANVLNTGHPGEDNTRVSRRQRIRHVETTLPAESAETEAAM